MEYFLGIIFGIVIVVGIKFLYDKFKNKNQTIGDKTEIAVLESKEIFPLIEVFEDNSIIPLEKNKITDSQIKNAVAKIENFVPSTATVGKELKKSKELLDNEKVFFSASKKGTENMLRVKNSNKVYGTQAVKGKFNKNTQFKKETNLVQSVGKDAIISAGFNAASMVVGQYYMNEINNKLDDLKNGIEEINDYLDAEYKSNLIRIVSKMKEIIDNKIEILENDYSRDKRYNEVLDLEDKCATLLGHANEMIKGNITKQEELNYKKYETNIKSINKWFIRQQFLQTLLLEIGNLRYALSNGTESALLSHTQYNQYLDQTNKTNTLLDIWNKSHCEKFGIDVSEIRKKGVLFNIRKNTIGKIKESYAYDKIDSEVAGIISNQINIDKKQPYNRDLANEKIRIQKYKGNYYNLNEENTNKQ